jgi:hypothetical protein
MKGGVIENYNRLQKLERLDLFLTFVEKMKLKHAREVEKYVNNDLFFKKKSFLGSCFGF